MKILMHLPAKCVMEFKAPLGLVGLTLGEGDQEIAPRFTVYLSASETEDVITGTLDEIIEQAERRLSNKAVGESFVRTLRETVDGMLGQPIPVIRLDRDDLIAEAQRVRALRRDWLISEIENGSYAAIEKLKSEYGESVKITVEVVG